MFQLDRLPSERRTEFVHWLLERRPVEWRAAYSVLVILSDAIPEPILPDVARWFNALALSKKRLWGWSLSYLDFWSRILPYVPNGEPLVGILLPAVLQACETPLAWHLASQVIVQCMVAADLPVARQIGDRLLATPATSTPSEANIRWDIVFQACFERRELLTVYQGWLLSPPSDTPHRKHLVRRAVDNIPHSTSLDDPSLRDWLRAQARAYCARVLAPGQQGGVLFPFQPLNFELTTWPAEETDLISDMLTAADAPQVAYANKVSVLEGLRHLSLKLPERGLGRIADFAMRWLQDGLVCSGPLVSGRISAVSFQGFDAAATTPALLSLAEALLIRLRDRTADQIADWLTAEGIRTPRGAADIVFLMMARLALRPGGDRRGLIGLTEAVVEKCAAPDPTPYILKFTYLLAPQDGSHSIILRSIRSPVCKILLRFWERRLEEYSCHFLPRVRVATALALRAWKKQATEHAALVLPAPLQEAIANLSQDARASVRWALLRPEEDAE